MGAGTLENESGRVVGTRDLCLEDKAMQDMNPADKTATTDDRCSNCGRAHEHGKWLTALLGDRCALCVLESNGDIVRNEPPMLADGGRR